MSSLAKSDRIFGVEVSIPMLLLDPFLRPRGQGTRFATPECVIDTGFKRSIQLSYVFD